jgi:hypothetical protein
MKKQMQDRAKEMGFTLAGYDGASKIQHLQPAKGHTQSSNKHKLVFLIAAFPNFNFNLKF